MRDRWTPVAAQLHAPCTVADRAERSTWSALDERGERDFPKVTAPPLDPDKP